MTVKEFFDVIDVDNDVRIFFVDYGEKIATPVLETFADKMKAEGAEKFFTKKVFRSIVKKDMVFIFFTED